MTQIIFENTNPQELTLNQGSINLTLIKGDNKIGLVKPNIQTQLVEGKNDFTISNDDQTQVNLNVSPTSIDLSDPDSRIALSVQENIVSLDTIDSSYDLAIGDNKVQLSLDAGIFGITENKFKFNINLAGIKDGSNLVYTTPHKFTENSFRYYRNGVRQRSGISNDYTISESGGVGSGFDTITLVAFPPLPWEELMADYITK